MGIEGKAGVIREAMGVVSLEGRMLGEVSRTGGSAEFRMTSVHAGCAFETVIPLAWVEQVGDYVFLSRSSSFVAANARRAVRIDAALGRAA